MRISDKHIKLLGSRTASGNPIYDGDREGYTEIISISNFLQVVSTGELEMSEEMSIIEKVAKEREDHKREERKVKRMIDTVKKWKEEGYLVEELEQELKEDPDGAKGLFMKYRKNIQRLKTLEAKFKALPEHETGSLGIDEAFKDPSIVDFLEERIDKVIELLDKKRDLKWKAVEKQIETGTDQMERLLEQQMNPVQMPVEPQTEPTTTFEEPTVPTSEEQWIDALKKPDDNWYIFDKRSFDVDTESEFIGFLIDNDSLRKAFKDFAIYWNGKKDGKYFEQKKDIEKDMKIIDIKNPHFVSLLYCLTIVIEESNVGVYEGPYMDYFKDYIGIYNGNFKAISQEKKIAFEDEEEFTKYYITERN